LITHLDKDLARAHAASNRLVVATKVGEGNHPTHPYLGCRARLPQRIEQTGGLLQPRQRGLHLPVELTRHAADPGCQRDHFGLVVSGRKRLEGGGRAASSRGIADVVLEIQLLELEGLVESRYAPSSSDGISIARSSSKRSSRR